MQNKKQAFDIISGICEINEKVWGNHAGSYEDTKEAAYQIEEALEGLNSLLDLANELTDEESDSRLRNNPTPKEISRAIVNLANGKDTQSMADVDRFDKALDAIYFAVGSMHKLGLSPYQIVEGLQVVHTANVQKTGEKDANGKVSKPKGFVAPEEKLQAILDRRVSS